MGDTTTTRKQSGGKWSSTKKMGQIKPSWRKIRRARQTLRYAQKLLWIRRDLLSEKQREVCATAIKLLQDTLLQEAWDKFEGAVTAVEQVCKELKPRRSFAGLRENLEAILVAVVVAGAVRTYFVQPFKIPTGSMQPTLYGNHQTFKLRVAPLSGRGLEIESALVTVGSSTDNDIVVSNDMIPPHYAKIWWNTAVGKVYITYIDTGNNPDKGHTKERELHADEQLLLGKTSIQLVNESEVAPPHFLVRIWDYLVRGMSYSQQGRRVSGDRIFVDRFTYNFRKPERGDVVVFRTRNIHSPLSPPRGDFYIKRLVGLGGEKIQIREGKLWINDQVVKSPAIFEEIYTSPAYNGYLTVKEVGGGYQEGQVALYSPDSSYTISAQGYFVFGDNTKNSTDSRYWGEFPHEDLIGRAFFVYWPFSPRFGAVK